MPDVDVLNEIEHRLLQEPEGRVLAILFLLLAEGVSRQPHDVDQILERVLERRPDLVTGPAWHTTQTAERVAEIICRWLAILAVAHRASCSRSRISVWFADPERYPDQVVRCVVELRDVLNADVAKPLRDEAFRLIKTTAQACSKTKAAEDNASGRVAAEIAASLFMCSGALDDFGLSETAVRRGNAQLFANAAIPVLRELADFPHPNVTRDVVRLCLHLAPSRGAEVLGVIAVVLEAHDDEYLRQAVPLEAVLEVVDRHVIASDELVREEHRVTGLRRLLEMLADRGRGDTVTHADRLGKTFQ